MKPVKENGHNGEMVQVFVPSTRYSTDTTNVEFGQVIRFTADGRYEFNSDGVRVPFTAGMTMGVPFNSTELRIYDYASGATLTAQIIEVM